MDADAVASLVGITGLPADQAAMYLEMAGGSLDTAISLFFDGGGGFSGGSVDPSPSESALPQTPAHELLFGRNPAPPSWIDQGFSFGEGESQLGVLQGANGPCGVLAAVNAEVSTLLLLHPPPFLPVLRRHLHRAQQLDPTPTFHAPPVVFDHHSHCSSIATFRSAFHP